VPHLPRSAWHYPPLSAVRRSGIADSTHLSSWSSYRPNPLSCNAWRPPCRCRACGSPP